MVIADAPACGQRLGMGVHPAVQLFAQVKVATQYVCKLPASRVEEGLVDTAHGDQVLLLHLEPLPGWLRSVERESRGRVSVQRDSEPMRRQHLICAFR